MAGKVIVNDLVKRYGDNEAVRGVSFEVADGEIFGLLGPNGAGKTSTLECVIGLRVPDSGTISVCGQDALAGPESVKRLVGAQLQATALQDKITPREAIKLFGSFYEKRASAESLIERFSLGEKADAPFDTLSGGQKQRLALALAFVNQPEVLFLDEPTAGLDPQSRRELHAAIRQMKTDGHTVVITTHYIEEAHLLCDRIAVIDHGRVIASGSPDLLIANSAIKPRITFRSASPIERQQLQSLPGVTNVVSAGEAKQSIEGSDGMVQLHTADIGRTIIELVKLLEAHSNELLDLSIQRPSLEDVFIELTGSSLRD